MHKQAKQATGEVSALIKDDANELESNTTSNGFAPSAFSCGDCAQTKDTLGRLNKEMAFLRSALLTHDVHYKKSGEPKMSAEEYRKRSWRVFGLFLDRIFFVMYLVLIILSLIFMFPRPT